jgi:hypothetical protein
MNQRTPYASTGEFFNTIGAKLTFGEVAMSVPDSGIALDLGFRLAKQRVRCLRSK